MAWRHLFGLILLAIGAGLLLQFAGIAPKFSFIETMAMWWPIIIVAVSLNQLTRTMDRPWSALIVFCVGVILLAFAQDRIPAKWWWFVTGLLLFTFSIRLLLPRGKQFSYAKGSPMTDKAKRFTHSLNEFLIFSGMHFHNESQQFQGGRISAIISDYEIDLRGAALSRNGGELDLTIVFGSMTVRIPESMAVSISGKPVFGYLEDHTKQIVTPEAGRPMLIIKTKALFSSIEITN